MQAILKIFYSPFKESMCKWNDERTLYYLDSNMYGGSTAYKAMEMIWKCERIFRSCKK